MVSLKKFVISFLLTLIIILIESLFILYDIMRKKGKTSMHGPKTHKLSINISEELRAKLKGVAGYASIPLGVFINRILIDEIKRIEKGEHSYIKIERKK